jgi:hypothetical protein
LPICHSKTKKLKNIVILYEESRWRISLMGTMVLAVMMMLFSLLHPVHVSLLNIDLNPETGKIEIVFKLFSDDFERIIMNKYNVDLDITSKVDPGEKTEFINKYIYEAFELRINGIKIDNWEYTGNQMNEEAIWLYYKNLWPGEMKEITVINSVMMDLYEDQTNMVIVSWPGKQNGYCLNNKEREITLIIQ